MDSLQGCIHVLSELPNCSLPEFGGAQNASAQVCPILLHHKPLVGQGQEFPMLLGTRACALGENPAVQGLSEQQEGASCSPGSCLANAGHRGLCCLLPNFQLGLPTRPEGLQVTTKGGQVCAGRRTHAHTRGDMGGDLSPLQMSVLT